MRGRWGPLRVEEVQVEPDWSAEVRAGVAWIRDAQSPAGDVPSFSSSLLEEPDWQPDRPNFVTALTVLALRGVPAPGVDEVVDRAVGYLLDQREAGGRWRYWSSSAPLHDYTPPDADDTACCALAVGASRAAVDDAVLLANRDPAGRFYTWFVPHPGVRSLRYRWAIRAERTAAVRARRSELWANSEAEPEDVDVVVNANVVRLLGPSRAPAAAVEWIASVVEAGAEVESDKWYRSRTALYRSLADSVTAGVERIVSLAPILLDRIVGDLGPEGCRDDLELADALRTLRILDAPGPAVRRFTEALLDRQGADGSWGRSICYFGGPQESFAWASEALATAAAVGALAGGVGATGRELVR